MATDTRTVKQPDVQLIANAVITDGRGRVLLTRCGDEADGIWWLPGAELQAYEHPDAALQRALDGLADAVGAPALHHVESFRGRRGWHLMFNYLVHTDPASASAEGRWFALGELPRFAHGKWEPAVIAKALADGYSRVSSPTS